MADTLAQLTDKVQATLFDDGSLFPDANVTAAARLALQDINRSCPQHAATTLTSVADQLVYELNDADPAAASLTDIVLEGDNDIDEPLKFYGFVEDGRWFFRLAASQPAGETLRAHYSLPHTLNGLDGAADSTLTDELNIAALFGTVYYAAMMRATRAIEANNVSPNVARTWQDAAAAWKCRFEAALERVRKDPPARGLPSSHAWNDDQHSTEYP